jgi:hypothetical protein
MKTTSVMKAMRRGTADDVQVWAELGVYGKGVEVARETRAEALQRRD